MRGAAAAACSVQWATVGCSVWCVCRQCVCVVVGVSVGVWISWQRARCGTLCAAVHTRGGRWRGRAPDEVWWSSSSCRRCSLARSFDPPRLWGSLQMEWIIEFERRREGCKTTAPQGRERGASEEQHVVRASDRASAAVRMALGAPCAYFHLPPHPSRRRPARTTPDFLSLRPGTRLFALTRFAFRGLLSADDYGPETGEAVIKWHWQRTGGLCGSTRLALDWPRPVTRARRGVGRLPRSHTHTRGNTPSSRI